jgi:hypothetical protein
MHCHSGGGPILGGHVAVYTVEIMRRRWTDVIDMGMVYIPDAAELCLRVFGWVPTVAEVPWFRGGLLDVFGRWSCRATIGISMNGLYGHEIKNVQEAILSFKMPLLWMHSRVGSRCITPLNPYIVGKLSFCSISSCYKFCIFINFFEIYRCLKFEGRK